MNIPFTAVPPKNKIAAIGSALVDICLLEEDAFLNSTGAKKGGMVLVDDAHIRSVLAGSKKEPTIVPGGSACNTVLGVGKLGGGARFVGKRGGDQFGALFEKGLRAHNVEPCLFDSETPTGHVLSIITPDTQRSMLTYLGASAETLPGEVSPELFSDAALVHIEGYLLFNPQLMLASLEAARKASALISLDLASYTVVEASKGLLDEITSKYVDILIANEDEARAFTGHADEQMALEALAARAEVAVMKLGCRGSCIAHGGTVTRIAPITARAAIDTTGAGDLWAAGFLYGLVHGYPIETCGRLGSACGCEVCQVVGANIPDEGWERIRKLL